MNTAKIKQAFERLAKTISDTEDQPTPIEDDLKESSLPTIRWGAVQSPRVAEACVQAVEEITAITNPEGAWSRSSVDDAVWSFKGQIVDLPREQRLAADASSSRRRCGSSNKAAQTLR